MTLPTLRSVSGTGFIVLALGLAPLAAHAQDATDRGPIAITTFEPTELERGIAAPGIAVTEGEAVYQTICAGCHMPEGEGAEGAGAYPALADNPRLEFPGYPITLVLYGQSAMPPFADLLDDEQVANLVDYLQSGLNDFEPTATVEAVATSRPETNISGPQEEHE